MTSYGYELACWIIETNFVSGGQRSSWVAFTSCVGSTGLGFGLLKSLFKIAKIAVTGSRSDRKA
jgi:hypothetical protein